MKIIGIIGSPRKERGLTNKVVQQALMGAAKKGAQTEKIFLKDIDPDYCVHCSMNCFLEQKCSQENALNTLFQKIEKADGLILGAPVYIWQANALTVAFMEKMRLKTGPWDQNKKNDKFALGIAVAGGSGTGVFPALKSIYSFFNLWKFNPLTPLPVTRFNLENIFEKANEKGEKMASNTIKKIDTIPELMATYDHLKYLNYTRADEFRWLAKNIIKGLKNNTGIEQNIINNFQENIKKGDELLQEGKRNKAMEIYMKTYQKSRDLW